MKVYVAGSGLETRRAKAAMQKLLEHDIEVTSTWIDVIALNQAGVANPRDASWHDRSVWSLTDLAEVERADVLWLLVPLIGVKTIGAWVELGFAVRGQISRIENTRRQYIVASGDTKQTIFTALATETPTDEDGLKEILRLRNAFNL